MPMLLSSSPSGGCQRLGRELSRPPVCTTQWRRSAIRMDEGTFAGARGNDKVAPIADLPALDVERRGPIEALYDKIEAASPQSDAQRSMQGQALTLAADVGRTRLLLFEHLGASIPLRFLVVLVFWLCIILASFGLFAPRNATVIAVLCVCALSVSAVKLFDPRARPLVRRAAPGLRRTGARGPGPARSLRVGGQCTV